MTDFYQPQILCKRKFSYQDIDLTVTKDSPREKVPAIQDNLQSLWDTKVADLKTQGLTIWDGTTYRVDVLTITPKRISMHISSTLKYRELFTAETFREHYEPFPKRHLRHLSTAAIIETADHQFIMGETTAPHRVQYDIIGGGVQENELVIGDSTDLQKTLYKEIQEEIGVLPTHIAEEYLCGIVVGSRTNIILLARVTLSLTSNEVRERFASRTDKDEMQRVAFFSETEFQAECQNSTTFRPFLVELLEV